jgi:tetratricopeptide (TPR) repeat protein
VIRWSPPHSERVAAPATALALLAAALERDPGNPVLHVRLAEAALDRFDYASAAAAFEAALRLDPAMPNVRTRLARCHNSQGRYERAFELLAPHDAPTGERGVALEGLGREREAETEYRAVLAEHPRDPQAIRNLGKLLRRSGRTAELLALCGDLAARGVGHAQLLYSWGTALALCGDAERASAILFDPRRVTELALPVPEGFADVAAFNAALAEELLSNPCRLTDLPQHEEANRGSSRVHALFAGRRPELIRLLLNALEACIDAHRPPRLGAFDPWLDARPAAARLHAWGLIQIGSDYEEWHLHRSGWLSGVYYVRVPRSVRGDGKGRGCIEFGAPAALQRAIPGYVPAWRHVPRQGSVLLAPSHYPHRTIPTGADEYRISFAFDVVPEG